MDKQIKAVPFMDGEECPKCGSLMKRYRHGNDWKPKERQPYWFAWWDKCKPCRYIKNYERSKVFRVSPSDPTPVIWDEFNVIPL